MIEHWEGGAPGGTPLMFLPGCPDSRLIARTGDAAAKAMGVRLISVNRPGYGRSLPGRSGHLSVADDVAGLADALGVDRYAVLGMSIGGTYALACAARHPARVLAAGAVAATAEVPSLDPPVHRDNLTPEQFEQVTALAAVPEDEAVAMLRAQFEPWAAGMAPRDPDDDALARRWMGAAHPLDAKLLAGRPAAELAEEAREALSRSDGYVRDAVATFRRWHFRPEAIGCRVHLWYGAHDPSASVRNGQWLQRRIPGSRLVVRPDTAHLGTLLEHWDAILAELVTAR